MKKIKVVAIEFTYYAIVWWDQFVLNRRWYHEMSIKTWEKMNDIIRKRFILSYYYRDLFQKLQSLTQGPKTIENCHKEMEIEMIWANVEEDSEATMASFLVGLDHDIENVIELQHYVELDNMVQMAIKVK